MLYDRRSRYSFCQSSAFQCPRADTNGGFPRAAPHHHCPFSARINQKHLVHDVLEQPTWLSPVSFSISGECSTRDKLGVCGGERKMQNMVKHIRKTLSRKDKARPETARLHGHAPERLHRELSISVTQGFQTVGSISQCGRTGQIFLIFLAFSVCHLTQACIYSSLLPSWFTMAGSSLLGGYPVL